MKLIGSRSIRHQHNTFLPAPKITNRISQDRRSTRPTAIMSWCRTQINCYVCKAVSICLRFMSSYDLRSTIDITTTTHWSFFSVTLLTWSHHTTHTCILDVKSTTAPSCIVQNLSTKHRWAAATAQLVESVYSNKVELMMAVVVYCDRGTIPGNYYHTHIHTRCMHPRRKSINQR